MSEATSDAQPQRRPPGRRPVPAPSPRPPVVLRPAADRRRDRPGPDPDELFVASLAACVGFYARRFLARHHLDVAGLRVDAAFTMSPDRPARVATITLRLLLPQPLEEHRRRTLLAVVDHCTVHNSLRTPPEVRIALAEPANARPAPPVTAGL